MLTWSWIIQITIISFILIFLVHHLIHFFKTMLTVPKIKYLVTSPNEKYKNIYETISHNHFREYENEVNKSVNSNKLNYTLEDILPPDTNTTAIIDTDSNNMKNELKNFIKNQLVN